MTASMRTGCASKRTCLLVLLTLQLASAAELPRTEALAGSRRIEFVRTLSSERETAGKRSFLGKVVDVIAGPRTWHSLVRPYSITTDSRGRILVTDPGLCAVHVFDLEGKHYRLIPGGKEPFQSPLNIALDAQDNIYVTDSKLGKIFVFDSRGKFQRYIGDIKGEGFFKRATGIAIDPKEQRIYVSDTLRHKVFKLDMAGNVVATFGQRGAGPGEFNFPTELAIYDGTLLVVDAMNFRIQTFDLQGGFRSAFGRQGMSSGLIGRPKGVALDSEQNLYVADALFETLQIFDRSGQLLYYFGKSGNEIGEFELPSGVWIDPQDRIYVADSYNRRIQIFQFTSARRSPSGGAK